MISSFLRQLSRDQSGSSAAEYALILAVISLATLAATFALSDAIGNAMSDAASCIQNGSASCR
jgi:pilus assembly protein Flp/PilA